VQAPAPAIASSELRSAPAAANAPGLNAAAVPNFVIAGAPKCGTTALYAYLRAHDRVFLSEPKEPHYFADDLLSHRSVTKLADYERLFAAATRTKCECHPRQHLAVGEASAWYLHSAVAIGNLLAYNPAVKLIVMLRNPVEMLPSLHSDLCWVCFEDEPDFEAAWNLQGERRAGRCVPRLCQVPWFLDYRLVGSLGSHVRRLLQIVPRSQVKFILFDDLCSSPRAVWEEVLQFLELPPDGRVDFPQVNSSKRNRSQWIARCRAAVVQGLPRPLVALGKQAGLGRLSGALRRWNTAPRPVAPLRAEFRAALAAEFSTDVELLGNLIGRDLALWQRNLP